jgi:hypothetical protein
MNIASIVRVRPSDVFPLIESSTRERLTYRVNNEILCEKAFIAVTFGLATFFSYVCYHALQNYGAL